MLATFNDQFHHKALLSAILNIAHIGHREWMDKSYSDADHTQKAMIATPSGYFCLECEGMEGIETDIIPFTI